MQRHRGYFGIGVEGLSKPMNAGNLFRSAHAFGAGFLFTIAATYRQRLAHSDTSQAPDQIPLYEFASIEDLQLPKGCRLVGIELCPAADLLPVFKHPPQAAYVLGPERGSLSPALAARCDHIVAIPTAFCINLAMAGVVVMYDRMLASKRFGARPVSQLTAAAGAPIHIHGAQKRRKAGKPKGSEAAAQKA